MWVAELDSLDDQARKLRPRSGSVSPKEFVAGLKKMKGRTRSHDKLASNGLNYTKFKRAVIWLDAKLREIEKMFATSTSLHLPCTVLICFVVCQIMPSFQPEQESSESNHLQLCRESQAQHWAQMWCG